MASHVGEPMHSREKQYHLPKIKEREPAFIIIVMSCDMRQEIHYITVERMRLNDGATDAGWDDENISLACICIDSIACILHQHLRKYFLPHMLLLLLTILLTAWSCHLPGALAYAFKCIFLQ